MQVLLNLDAGSVPLLDNPLTLVLLKELEVERLLYAGACKL